MIRSENKKFETKCERMKEADVQNPSYHENAHETVKKPILFQGLRLDDQTSGLQ